MGREARRSSHGELLGKEALGTAHVGLSWTRCSLETGVRGKASWRIVGQLLLTKIDGRALILLSQASLSGFTLLSYLGSLLLIKHHETTWRDRKVGERNVCLAYALISLSIVEGSQGGRNSNRTWPWKLELMQSPWSKCCLLACSLRLAWPAFLSFFFIELRTTCPRVAPPTTSWAYLHQ